MVSPLSIRDRRQVCAEFGMCVTASVLPQIQFRMDCLKSPQVEKAQICIRWKNRETEEKKKRKKLAETGETRAHFLPRSFALLQCCEANESRVVVGSDTTTISFPTAFSATSFCSFLNKGGIRVRLIPKSIPKFSPFAAPHRLPSVRSSSCKERTG
ncbi:hypothetical protein PHSY_005358 [Pseudozyma hubeiensis SY62]|uniref:Uncharacterized protein n=1 Tax=Pseudozyma hubeiensis (strain SY62) TaxID=1305764 RepID=R9P8T8_PSEHS|nr:hypothetical protein PHSY_005358 [Pseudozyma hubeiensis SY62]GAC97771.1 hypothetical protein PHSY_005358 [Pseudozyma hubeiensis SY62]